MGYLKPAEVDEVRLASDDAYWVKMKRRATYGDQLAAQAAMVQVSTDLGPASGASLNKIEWDAYLQTLTVSLIVEWNLTDANEQPLPISRASLAQLDPTDGDLLAQEAQKRLQVRPAEKERPFVTPSGQPSTEAPPTT